MAGLLGFGAAPGLGAELGGGSVMRAILVSMPGGLIAYVAWTVIFLTVWGVAIREARAERAGTGTP